MKQFSLLLALFTFISLSAQKKNHKKSDFSPEQKTQLIVKKLTNALELSDKQSNQITPLIAIKVQKMKEHKAFRTKKHQKISSDEKFEMAMNHLDQQAKMQSEMKKILNKDQYTQWKAMQKKHHRKSKSHKANSKNKTHAKKGKGKRKHKEMKEA